MRRGVDASHTEGSHISHLALERQVRKERGSWEEASPDSTDVDRQRKMDTSMKQTRRNNTLFISVRIDEWGEKTLKTLNDGSGAHGRVAAMMIYVSEIIARLILQ